MRHPIVTRTTADVARAAQHHDQLNHRLDGISNIRNISARKWEYFDVKIAQKHTYKCFKPRAGWMNDLDFSFIDLHLFVHKTPNERILSRRFNPFSFWKDVSRSSVEDMTSVLVSNIHIVSPPIRAQFAETIARSLAAHIRCIGYNHRSAIHRLLRPFRMEKPKVTYRNLHREKMAFLYEEQSLAGRLTKAVSAAGSKSMLSSLEGTFQRIGSDLNDTANTFQRGVISELQSFRELVRSMFLDASEGVSNYMTHVLPYTLSDFIVHFGICLRQIFTAPSIFDSLMAVYSLSTRYISCARISSLISKGLVALVQLIYSADNPVIDPADILSSVTMDAEVPILEEQDLFDTLFQEEIGPAKDVASLFAAYAKMGRFAQSSTSIINLVSKIYDMVSRAMSFYSYGCNPEEAFRKRYPDIAAWIKTIHEVLLQGGIPALSTNVSLSVKAAFLHNQGSILAKTFFMSKPPAEAVRVFQYYLSVARSVSTSAASVSKGLRVPPVVIRLQGPPGVGKTNSIQAIVRAVCAAMEVDDAAKQIYQKPSKAEYWEGYAGQLAMLIDDFAQSNEVSDRRQQAMDVIYAAGTNPFPLNMASAESKGNFHFNSRLVFLTTNMESFQQCGLTDPAALLRRIDLTATVHARDEVAIYEEGRSTGRVDPEKVRERTSGLGYSPHAIAYRTEVGDQTVETNRGAPSDLTFTQFVKLILSQMADKQRYFVHSVCGCAFTPMFEGDEDFGVMPDRVIASLMDDPSLAPGAYPSPLQEQSDDAMQHDITTDDIPNYFIGDETYDDPNIDWYAVLRDQHRRGLADVTSPHGLYQTTMRRFRDFVFSMLVWAKQHPAATAASSAVLVSMMIAPLVASFFEKRGCSPVEESGETVSLGRRARRARNGVQQESGETVSLGRRARRARAAVVTTESGETVSVGRRAARTRVSCGSYLTPESDTIAIGQRAKKNRAAVLEPIINESDEIEIAAPLEQPMFINKELVEQDTPDGVASMLISSRIASQLYFVFALDADKEIVTAAHGLVVVDRVMLIPSHMLASLRRWKYLKAVGPFTVTVPIDTVVIVGDHPDLDTAVIQFKNGLPLGRDIRKNFIHAAELGRDLSTTALVSRSKYGDTFVLNTQTFTNTAPITLTGSHTTTGKPIQLVKGFRYPSGMTSRGDCGSPLLVLNKFIQGKILGLHYAGVPGGLGGFSSSLTYEDVMELTSDCQFRVVRAELQNLADWEVLRDFNNQGFEILGVVPTKMGCYSPSKTSIIKSPLYGCLGPAMTKPALLMPRDGVDPMALAQKKNFGESFSMSQERLDMITTYLIARLRALRGKRRLRVLTQDQAWNGIIDQKHVEPMNLNTSAGYPYKKRRGGSKKAWVKTDQNNHVMEVDSELQYDIDERIIKAKRGIALPTIWVDTLKDERRPIEKVDAGKTRLFMNGPVDYTVVFRMYFADFISFIMDVNDRFECALGINPHSREWDQKVLSRFEELPGDNYIAGDYSNFDGSIQQQLIDAAVQIANALYDGGGGENLVRDTLAVDLYNAIHLDRRVVYQVFRGNPSGNPFTTVMNSLINSMLMIYAWIDLGYKIGEYPSWVRAKNFGDDNVLKVHPHADKYTMRNIAASLAPLGITYTPASKNGEQYDYIPLSEVTFLKRAFVRLERRVAAPLDTTSLNEMLYWYREGNDKYESVCAVVRSHMDECIHYGKEFYDDRYRALVEICGEHEIDISELFVPYAERITEWYDMDLELQTLDYSSDSSSTCATVSDNVSRDRVPLPSFYWIRMVYNMFLHGYPHIMSVVMGYIQDPIGFHWYSWNIAYDDWCYVNHLLDNEEPTSLDWWLELVGLAYTMINMGDFVLQNPIWD